MPKKLTDTQLVMLSAAAQRDDHAVVLPKSLKGGAATKVVNTLTAKGLVKEVRAKPDMPAWRRDEAEAQSYALIATRAGLKAINIDDETAGPEFRHAKRTPLWGPFRVIGIQSGPHG